MGEFNEDPIGRREDKIDFDSVPEGENLSQSLETGRENVSGVRNALENISSPQNKPSNQKVVSDIQNNIDFDEIRKEAFNTYSAAKYSHLDSDLGHQIGTEIEGMPDESAEDLITYISDHGGITDLMRSYNVGPTPKSSEVVLDSFGLLERDTGQLTEFGKYVADQVFEYSED